MPFLADCKANSWYIRHRRLGVILLPFGNVFGFFVPLIFIFLGFRLLRHFFRGISRPSRPVFDEYEPPKLPYDDYSAVTRYAPAPTESESYEHSIFKLADAAKGRLTVSDIVIGTDLGLKDAEQAIDALVDGIHVTMEVTGEGRVVYEFPEIIAKYSGNDDSGIV
jgi:hypothetical protein